MASNIDKYVGVFLILLSIFLWWSLQNVPTDIAYYPKFLIYCLLVCSLTLIIKPLISRSPSKSLAIKSTRFFTSRSALELVTLSITYILVLPLLGFIAASIVFLIVLMWRLGVRNWIVLVGVSVSTVGCVYLGFERGLMVFLPDGHSVWSLFY